MGALLHCSVVGAGQGRMVKTAGLLLLCHVAPVAVAVRQGCVASSNYSTGLAFGRQVVSRQILNFLARESEPVSTLLESRRVDTGLLSRAGKLSNCRYASVLITADSGSRP
jgi:hypothetical protein